VPNTSAEVSFNCIMDKNGGIGLISSKDIASPSESLAVTVYSYKESSITVIIGLDVK